MSRPFRAVALAAGAALVWQGAAAQSGPPVPAEAAVLMQAQSPAVRPADPAAPAQPAEQLLPSQPADAAIPQDSAPAAEAPAAPVAESSLPDILDAETGIGQGIASWYGPGFHGRRTASGERYDMHGLTAAHRSLPFGTIVRVRSLVNGRTVDVRINDRGPRPRHRVIDLSRGAAEALGLIDARTGTKPVALSILRSVFKSSR